MSRITIVSGSMPPLKCGVGYYTYHLLEALTKSEVVSLVTTSGYNSHPRVDKTAYVDAWKIGNLRKILKSIQSTEPDIIHIQYPAKGYGRKLGINLLPMILKKQSKKTPILLTLHEYYGSGFLGKARNLLTAWFADKILVSNPYDFACLPKHLRKKTEIVPIGSSVPVSTKNKKHYLNLLKSINSEGDKPVVFFGFPFPNKGLEVLIAAAVKYNFPVLFLCGFDEKDPYQKQLLNSINKAKINGAKLHTAGFLDDTSVSEILSESDIFALPQAFPLTAKSSSALAAVAHDMVVVSKAAEKKDFSMPYINNKNSVLLDLMNEETLGGAITSLRENHRKLNELKKGATELTSYFSWENIVKLHRKSYRGLENDKNID